MLTSLVDQEDGVDSRRDGCGDLLARCKFMASVLQAGRIRAAPLSSFGHTAPKM